MLFKGKIMLIVGIIVREFIGAYQTTIQNIIINRLTKNLNYINKNKK